MVDEELRAVPVDNRRLPVVRGDFILERCTVLHHHDGKIRVLLRESNEMVLEPGRFHSPPHCGSFESIGAE